MALTINSEKNPELFSKELAIYNELEFHNWAPWLRFSPEDFAEHRQVFPDGQITLYDNEDKPIVALETVRINWSGKVEDLTTWDDVAGKHNGFSSIFQPNGNTIALLSMSVRPDVKKTGLASSVIETLIEKFQDSDVDYIIGDFRPSDFGKFKKQSGDLNFTDYINSRREDGQRIDSWLRAVEKTGGKIIKPDPRAMVVEATLDDLAIYYSEHGPEKWRMIDIRSNEAKQLISWHQPEIDLEKVDEIWECEETGSWYLDRDANKAVYIESNVWGQLPFKSIKNTCANLSNVVKIEDVEATNRDRLDVNYHLDMEAQDMLQKKLVGLVKETFPQEGIYGAWIDSNHELSNLIRTFEANTPEFRGIEQFVDDSVEARSKFFALVDTRYGNDRVIHATRVSGEVFSEKFINRKISQKNRGTNFIVINELIESGQGLTAEEFSSFYESIGINLNKSLGVETNFTVGERVDTHVPGIRVSDLGYIAIFLLLERKGFKPDETYIFANVNSNTIRSMTPLGFKFEHIADRKDLKCVASDGNLTDEFRPVGIPLTYDIVELYKSLRQFAAKELEINAVD